MTTRRSILTRAGLLAVAALVGGCGGPIAANPPVQRPAPPPAATPRVAAHDPVAIMLPADDGPHHRLTEWWYYTGHLQDLATSQRYGFEFVIFRAERGDFPTTWASHLAVTDEGGQRFTYGQRAEIGQQVDRSPRDQAGVPTGFSLTIRSEAAGPDSVAGAPWSMERGGGREHLEATLTATEAAHSGTGIALDLELDDGPSVLHDRDGWIDFGEAGGSYYYSRPRLPASGTLTVGGHRMMVRGDAWFDHQWGDFIAVGGGGWDWFAVNLDDGTDLTLSLVRDRDGGYPLIYGTLRRPNGTVVHLPADTFSVTTSGAWRSRATGATYPAQWSIRIPGEGLVIDLKPTVAAQELDTRPTSGVVYWEGSQVVGATRAGRPVAGQAYVELTGYASALPSTTMAR